MTKYDGSREAYNQNKVLSSIVRSGVRKNEVVKILGRVESKIYDGISTGELYQVVAKEIEKQISPKCSHFYRLREALGKMGSFDFEEFATKLLEKQGYLCQHDIIVPGFCVSHQIDIIAKDKNDILFYVEIKHHRNFHRNCGLGAMTEFWARLEDLTKGFNNGQNKYNFSKAWLITNTKFSGHAKKYSRCKELKLTGWRYTLNDTQKEKGMEKMVEELGLSEVDKLIEKVIN